MRKLGFALACLLVWVAFGYAQVPGATTRQRPLTVAELKTLSREGVPEKRLLDLVEQLGIGFAPTREALEELRRAGLPESVLEEVSEQIPRGQSAEFYMREGDRLNQEGRMAEAAIYYRLGQGLPLEEAPATPPMARPGSSVPGVGTKGSAAKPLAKPGSKPQPEEWEDEPPTASGQSLAVSQPPSAGQAATGIFVNGRELTSQQVQEIRALYMFVAPPGRYWYDARSGLWGVMGHEAAGFLRPGHNFGPMPPNPSNGNTGVFINGREINLVEARYCQQLFGAVYRGRWWLDGMTGNLGLEGNPYPIANVFAILQQRQRSGQGGGYSWSSKITGAYGGSDGSCSYVSIPGSGSVMTGNCD